MVVNRISEGDPVLESISISNLVAHLQRTGWTRVNHPNDKVFLFQGPPDDEGEALQLVIPRNHDLQDANSRLAEALNVLAVIHRMPLKYLIDRIGLDSKDETQLKTPSYS